MGRGATSPFFLLVALLLCSGTLLFHVWFNYILSHYFPMHILHVSAFPFGWTFDVEFEFSQILSISLLSNLLRFLLSSSFTCFILFGVLSSGFHIYFSLFLLLWSLSFKLLVLFNSLQCSICFVFIPEPDKFLYHLKILINPALASWTFDMSGFPFGRHSCPPMGFPYIRYDWVFMWV